MKVAILTSSIDTTNGWGRYTVNLVHSLRSQGIKCVIFTEDRSELVGKDVDIPIVRLNSKPGSGWRNLVRMLKDWWRIRRDAHSFDVFHVFTETHIFLAWLVGRPYVVSTHGTYTLRFFKHPLVRIFARRAFQQATSVIITSEFTLQRISSYVMLTNTTFLPNGVDTATFFRDSLVKREPHTFITVGAVKPRKGQDLGIKALVDLRMKFPDALYIVVGKIEFGSFFEELQTFIRNHNLSGNVKFEHGISDKRLVELYNQSSVFVLPSRVDKTDSFEGYPLSLLEASACGLPIIGSRGCGAEHLIKDGDNGYLLNPEDVTGLVRCLTVLFSDPREAFEMGRRAMAVAQNLSWHANAKRVITIYHSA